jgi:hypothetical protein
MPPDDPDSVEPVALKNTTLRGEIVSLSNNMITWFGLMVVAVSLCLLLTFVLFAVIVPDHNPYVDVLGYLVLPGVLIGGLILCPIGIFWTRRRRRRSAAEGVISVRFGLVFMGVTFFLMLPILGISGYEGYHYTESAQFCTNVCHAVMEPQGTTYAYSPHAKVSCAECHIGAGASPFVKSKLSGLRQVLAVWRESYSKPIPPAITDLRPARETCEQCHWPQKFFGDQLRPVVRFSSDERNTRYEVQMLLKTGGADESLGRSEGIHMHMLQDVEYVAVDDHMQEIPWVKYTDNTGRTTIFRNDGEPTSAAPPEGHRRRLDCMDCHNRGAHEFRAPQESVDHLLDAGKIDTSLPFVKREIVNALSGSYTDKPEALAAIAEKLVEFYRTSYPELTDRGNSDMVKNAVQATQQIYSNSMFPGMKVTWKSYPNNIGHLNSPGCFRCHDGRHVNEAGVPISSQCDVCHTFLHRSESGDTFVQDVFDHPMKIHDLWDGLGPHATMRCDQCHTGGPILGCTECHESGAWLEERGIEAFRKTKRKP